MLSKNLLTIIVVYFLPDFSHEQRDKLFFRNDYTYLDSVEGFYKFHSTLRTWEESKRICALEGASLFYPETEDEAQAVLSFWNRTEPNIGWIYVGMSDLMTTGVFETIDGKFVSELDISWEIGQPNSRGAQHCACLNYGKMHDCSCNLQVSFICKKKLELLEWNSNCNMSNLDYAYEGTGKYYKLHTTPLNWTEAYAVCRAERSHLAVINDRKDLEYLANLTKSSWDKIVVGDYFRGIYHVGFHSKLQAGWQTVRGAPLTIDDDAWWDNNQPILDEYK